MATSDLDDVTGFVLREFKYKESSKIVEVFTKNLGRISIIAKGVLKKNAKNLSLTARFMKVNLSLYKSGKDFYGIKEGHLLETYKISNKNFDIILYKSAMCDLLLRTIDETQIQTVYTLLDNSFSAFENARDNYINIFLAFLIKYISFSGLKPNFSTCGICGKIIERRDGYFSIEEASMICNDDMAVASDKIYLNHEQIRYFMKLLYTKSEDLSSIDPPEDYEKVARLIIDYCLKRLELRNFSSMDWVYNKLSERN